MLGNFTLETVKILASRFPVRHGRLITKVSIKKGKKSQTLIKPQGENRRGKTTPKKKIQKFVGGSGANDLNEWRIVKSCGQSGIVEKELLQYLPDQALEAKW